MRGQMSENARERKCEEAILRESERAKEWASERECEEVRLVSLFRPRYPKILTRHEIEYQLQ